MVASFVSKQLRAAVGESRAELVGWAKTEFLSSFLVVGHALLSWASSSRDQLVAGASRKVSRFSFVVSIVAFAVLSLLWAALILVLWLTAGLVTLSGHAGLEARLWLAYDAVTFRHVLHAMAVIVPQCTVCFLHYWAYEDQDKVFISALRHQASLADIASAQRGRLHNLASALEELPLESTFQWFRRSLSAGARGLC
eukprot:CAMPEP_0204149142 /NCGR_PEP_ID=MMETSP0361-20130328/24160_1 /ASSEMBLY_ACC=CAM_ASM_000343 /TAXON_ID=268821 /ORGANISM="Scrippsiella Hangoei, Strain SHTV-5" /LENGTH=196 /DNA_ID=CAMNT_0051103603 /DNA_START=35 /DNA_END=622 /DNA_ORIENTATION=+